MTLTIIDNFLTPSYFEEIHRLLISWDFPWYCQPDITTGLDTGNGVGFSHNFFVDSPTSPYCNLVMPFLYQVKDTCGAKQILRCRGDLTVINPNKLRHSPHVDFKFPHYSAIFYVNDSDGETVFFNQKWSETQSYENLSILEVVDPKPNRVVIFDGDMIHTGHSPEHHQTRVILNSNYV